jgi:hypothetical protein
MGIPRFFYYCYKNFETSIEYITESVPVSSIISQSPVDFIHFDLNAIIHPVCQEVFKYGNHAPEQSTLLKQVKHVAVTSARINDVYDKVCQVIEKYTELLKPTSGIYIAIDGVAGMSKCTQQRQRRFRNSSSDEKKFDPNCISTGTVFMDRLCKHIDVYLKKQVSTKWNNLELIFSNDKVSGEGEHKILKHLQLNPELSSVVISPDADLFMLLLGCMKFDGRKLYIFRENIYKNIDCRYFLVDIEILANEICKQVDDEKKYEKSNVIRDFIFYCFMLGNDFLPHIPCVDLSYRGLDLLFDIYNQTINSHGLLIKDNSVNVKSFLFFLEQIANNEKKILLEKYKNNKNHNDPYLEKCLLDQDGEDMNMEKYRDLYYKNKLNDEQIQQVCKDYIEGMMFVFQYYTKGIPSWKWFFTHHYAPFSYDIAKCVKRDSNMLNVAFLRGEKMSPIQQLMCILPPSSKKLLPECLQTYYDSENKILGKWMAKDVKIDYDFRQNEWESLVLLPFIDVKDFETIYKLERDNFSSLDKNRDCEGKIFVYYQEFSEVTKQMENVIEMVTPTEEIERDVEYIENKKGKENGYNEQDLEHKIKINDIDMFYQVGKKYENDKNNKLREEILLSLSNNSIPEQYFVNERWSKLRDRWANIIKTNNIKKIGGQKRYDFIMSCNSTNKDIKLEFKFNSTSIEQLPQFLQVASNKFFEYSYAEFFYDNYLEKFKRLCKISDDIEKSVYLKYIHSFDYTKGCNFFEKLKNNTNAESDEAVALSITEYLEKYSNTINLNKLKDEINTSLNKQYIFWCPKQENFIIDNIEIIKDVKIDDYTKTCIKVSSEKLIFTLRLTWRNHKGVLYPAFQIKLKKN